MNHAERPFDPEDCFLLSRDRKDVPGTAPPQNEMELPQTFQGSYPAVSSGI